MSKISDYKFEKLVREMYANGKSMRSITRELNALIPQDDEPISEMAVSRWLRADKKQLPMVESTNTPKLSDNGVEESEDINPYLETLKLVDDCDYQIEILKKQIEKATKFTQSNSDNSLASNKKGENPQSLLISFLTRKQSLLADIANYQKEMASFAQVKETLKIVFDTLQKVSPEAYEQFKKEIIEKQQIKNLVR